MPEIYNFLLTTGMGRIQAIPEVETQQNMKNTSLLLEVLKGTEGEKGT